MQQTEKYKLNLVERDDVFSPDPLNENMEKVERALESEAAARAAADAALDQRLQVFEARHVAIGTYAPALEPLDIDLGFEPKAVLFLATNDSIFSGMLVPNAVRYDAALTATGFQIEAAGGAASSSSILNRSGVSFAYLALG